MSGYTGSISQPVRMDLKAFRNSAFPIANDQWRIRRNGVALTFGGGVHAIMQIRLYEGAPNPPLVDLDSDNASGDRIIIVDSDAGFFYPFIRQVTLEAMAAAVDGQPLAAKVATFTWDLRMGLAGVEHTYVGGKFILQTGTTR